MNPAEPSGTQHKTGRVKSSDDFTELVLGVAIFRKYSRLVHVYSRTYNAYNNHIYDNFIISVMYNLNFICVFTDWSRGLC